MARRGICRLVVPVPGPQCQWPGALPCGWWWIVLPTVYSKGERNAESNLCDHTPDLAGVMAALLSVRGAWPYRQTHTHSAAPIPPPTTLITTLYIHPTPHISAPLWYVTARIDQGESPTGMSNSPALFLTAKCLRPILFQFQGGRYTQCVCVCGAENHHAEMTYLSKLFKVLLDIFDSRGSR